MAYGHRRLDVRVAKKLYWWLLWADPKPIPPWDWRQGEREKRQTSRSDVDTGYWLNTSTGVRHNRNRGVW